jgi:hypothetical protein
MLKLLITGTGRCGTRFMADWLTASGTPCGHEKAFGYAGYTTGPEIADASWLAVPYLGLVPDSVRIIHLVRNPLHVVRSFLGTNHFGPFTRKHLVRPWHRYMSLHFGYNGAEPVQQAMKYWVKWNVAIEAWIDARSVVREWSDDRIRIENLRSVPWQVMVAQSIGADVDAMPSPETNRHRHAPLERLPRNGWWDQLASMAERYGYDPATL